MAFENKHIIVQPTKSLKRDGTPRKNARKITGYEPKKTKELSIKEKIFLIEYSQNHTVRDTAREFKVGLGTVVNIKRRKEEYIRLHNEETISPDRKRKFKQSPYDEVNKLCWSWFTKSRTLKVPVSGPIIQETARKFAVELKLPAFKASNGWLDRFMKAHNINLKVISAEEPPREDDAGIKFLNNLKNICKDYQARDIFNVDETGLCWRALPERSWLETQKHTKGNKVIKEKVIMLVAVSAMGEKLRPLVVGRIGMPQYLRNLENFQVSYKSSWMSLDIFQEWLQTTNDKFFHENRKVLLLLHTSPFHPFIGLSNITLCFLPNTASYLQPLGQGIIKTFKANYRKNLLKHLIVALELRINSKVSFFDMLIWIKRAWDEVPSHLIQNCFCHSGFKVNVEPHINSELDANAELNELINQAHALYLIKEKISADEFHKFDDELLCVEAGEEVDLFNVMLQETNAVTVAEVAMDADDDDLTLDTCIDYNTAMLRIRELKHFTVLNDVNFIDDILNIEKKLHDAIIGSQRFALNEFFY